MQEIESQVIKYTRNVARRRKKDVTQVNAIEKEQSTEYRAATTANNEEMLKKKIEEKNQYMIEQRNKPRYRIGKQQMLRSQKPRMQKKKKKKEIDPEKLAFMTYLGYTEGD